MNRLSWNKTVLCVDDEPGVLAAYREILEQNSDGSPEVQDRLSARRRRTRREVSTPTKTDDRFSYRVLTASSGEEAVELVSRELEHGRQIAVGFFDMLMPGGIDGQETITRIRALDNQVLCAVVTAYTDRNTAQIGAIFDRQDDWLYFNKPFTMGELAQATLHLVSAWNQRRYEEALISDMEMMQNGLISILDFVHDMNKISPLLLDLLLEGVLGHFLRLVGSSDGYIQLGNNIESATFVGVGLFQGITATEKKFARQQEIAARAIRNSKTIIVDNMAAIPLHIGTLVQGVLFVQQQKAFAQDPKLLDMFVIQAVNMIENSMVYRELHKKNRELSRIIDELRRTTGRLSKSEQLREEYEKLTYYDSLTGIPNRRYLEVQFKEMIAHCLQKRISLACLMIDIDHFKQINDRNGHIVGDHVLEQMGEILGRLKRGHEFIARYGGEEFTVLLEGVSPENALALGERIRSYVAGYCFAVSGTTVRTTISIGIAVDTPTLTTSMEEIISKSDRALYDAKNKGRNRCVLFSQ